MIEKSTQYELYQMLYLGEHLLSKVIQVLFPLTEFGTISPAHKSNPLSHRGFRKMGVRELEVQVTYFVCPSDKCELARLLWPKVMNIQ